MANELTPPDDAPEPPWLDQFVDNQRQELALRAEELELAKQQDTHNIEYAKLSLAAQERDRTHDRDCARLRAKDGYRMVILLVLIVAALIGVAIYSGKESVALELVKVIGYTLVGAFGGYGYGKRAAANSTDTAPS